MPRVRMYYPPGDRYQHASDSAFEAVYRDEGWVLVDDPEGDPVADVEPTAKRAQAK